MGQSFHSRWPDCPYCHYQWPKTLEASFLVCSDHGQMQTAIMCPCKKTCVFVRLNLLEAVFIDLEAAKHGLPESKEE